MPLLAPADTSGANNANSGLPVAAPNASSHMAVVLYQQVQKYSSIVCQPFPSSPYRHACAPANDDDVAFDMGQTECLHLSPSSEICRFSCAVLR